MHALMGAHPHEAAHASTWRACYAPLSRYAFSKWGHVSQPHTVKAWGYPISFKDLSSGEVAQTSIETGKVWDQGKKAVPGRVQPLELHFPVPFTATFSSLVTCFEVRAREEMLLPYDGTHLRPSLSLPPLSLSLSHTHHQVSVKDWLHITEVCLDTLRPPALDAMVQERAHAEARTWSTWCVLAPFRSYEVVEDFAATLLHYVLYHAKVGPRV
jgi:hypothetical protein